MAAALECAPKIPLSEQFEGDYHKFQGFINQCHLLFLMRPSLHPDSQMKVGCLSFHCPEKP